MRILALDVDDKRIGIALSDPLRMLAHQASRCTAGTTPPNAITTEICKDYKLA